MSLPVPLGVRLYSIVDAAIERWVTRWVDDISFRSVVPGGFASATITLRVPRHMAAIPGADVLGFSQLAELFRRIQIVDLRTMEVAWEGRIEDPARQVEPNAWQIGALGSMVAATDIQRPVLYIDSSLDRWVPTEDMNALFQFVKRTPALWNTSKDDASRTLITAFTSNMTLGTLRYSWRYDTHGFDQPISRFTVTFEGAAVAGSSADQTKIVSIVGLNGSNTSLAQTAFSAGSTTKTLVSTTNITDTNQRIIAVGTNTTGTYTFIPPDDSEIAQKLRNPIVVGQRRDRFENKLTAASSYTTNYVTVAQVVEDVIGRFLVGGWYEGGNDTPWPGSVRSADVYIDASSTTQILHLMYPNGATAADILNDLVTKVQTNAYWAIWESTWKANDGAIDPFSLSGFRFEWATWPNNAGYFATSQDGLESQPNGDDVYNFIFYRYQDTGDNNQWHISTAWTGGDQMIPEMNSAGFSRAITVNKDDPTDGTTADSLADAYRISVNKVQNAGTITIKRPIQYYDAGANSWSGGGRMLDPWMLRPGKLIRITDLPPRAGSQDMSYGTTLPSSSLDGTIFRVVATEYSSRDNSCRLELDQVARWQVPTQISTAASSGPKTIRIQ